MLVLPASDPALLARRAVDPERASRAAARPVKADRLTALVGGVAVGEHLTRWTAIAVAGGLVNEVVLAKAPLGHRVGGDRLDDMRRDAGLLAGQHLRSAVVAAAGGHPEALAADHVLGSLAHGAELRAVAAGHHRVVGNYQMVPSLDGGLHIVADDP